MTTPDLDDRIPDILDKVDLDEQVRRRGGQEVRPVGGRVLYHCPGPSHDDRHPSFDTYQPAGGGPRRWACRSQCGEGGDAIDLLVWLDRCTKAEAIEKLASEVGLERPERKQARPDNAKWVAEHKLMVRWCASRGWGPWVVDALGLTVVIDQFGKRRIRFPFRLAGHGVPYHQDRAIDPNARVKWLSPRGKRPILHEADRLALARERGHVFIVEGVSDVAALVDVYTQPAVVGVPGSSAWQPKWASLFRGLVVYVITDNDEAGTALRVKLDSDLKPVSRAVWHVWVPESYNDVAAWRAGLDSGAFDSQLTEAADHATGDCTLREVG